VPFKELWSNKYGIPLIKNLMSSKKCFEIMRYLRFDDKEERANRTTMKRNNASSQLQSNKKQVNKEKTNE
jgi:hypothetical protein